MLGQALQRFPTQVQAVERRIGVFQAGDDAQRMAIVVEATGLSERRRQGILAGMAERRVAEVVSEAQGLGQVLVQAQRPGHGPPDLRDLDRMGQAHPEMVAVGGDEYLRLVAKAAKGNRMDDPVAVALEDVARAAGAAVGFLVGPAARSAWLRGEVLGKRHQLLSFSILIWAGLRVHLKLSTPALSSFLTNAWASSVLGKGPTSRRK